MNSRKTLEKCRKIMRLFDSNNKQHDSKKPANSSIQLSQGKYKLSKKLLPSKQQKQGQKSQRRILNNTSLSLKSVKCSPSPCKSLSKDSKKHQNIYNRQSRYEKIMKLEVKPQTSKKIDPRNSYLQSSRVSYASVSSVGSKSIKKETRLDKIMKLKVSKPQTQSTLKNYQPVQRERAASNKENTDYNPVLEMKRCKDVIRKQQKQEQKEDRLWKVFERERELRMKQKSSNNKLSYERERSLQKRFDSLVQKELRRIQEQKQLEQRKELGFSPYLFPSY